MDLATLYRIADVIISYKETLNYSVFFFFISKLHTQYVLNPRPHFQSLLWEKEVPFEPELIGSLTGGTQI
jgi:hypothetical protein